MTQHRLAIMPAMLTTTILFPIELTAEQVDDFAKELGDYITTGAHGIEYEILFEIGVNGTAVTIPDGESFYKFLKIVQTAYNKIINHQNTEERWNATAPLTSAAVH